MKTSALLISGFSLALALSPSLAQAAGHYVKLDSGVQFSASGADCEKNELTVQRRFRNETHPISPEACAAVKASTLPFNVMGLNDAGTVVTVGYTQNGDTYLDLP